MVRSVVMWRTMAILLKLNVSLSPRSVCFSALCWTSHRRALNNLLRLSISSASCRFLFSVALPDHVLFEWCSFENNPRLEGPELLGLASYDTNCS
ncbi:hypothetical protein WN944_009740 [Citrus x changshan-huyou]|uniref:Secreted protein n=1 Tax=Citrus x changshan-huyou TaxID=2935761 RepID=A0AAP0MTL7_9ROSI